MYVTPCSHSYIQYLPVRSVWPFISSYLNTNAYVYIVLAVVAEFWNTRYNPKTRYKCRLYRYICVEVHFYPLQFSSYSAFDFQVVHIVINTLHANFTPKARSSQFPTHTPSTQNASLLHRSLRPPCYCHIRSIRLPNDNFFLLLPTADLRLLSTHNQLSHHLYPSRHLPQRSPLHPSAHP